jgi:cyclopropane fatty-acyl-phospholipid synthase-like methyltransferase
MTTPHPHDLPAEDCEFALAASDRPDLLGELMQTSREAFGFYNVHFPHTINYPWAASNLEGLPADARVLDIGAGISPMPLYLARHGMRVDCVDYSDDIRTLPVRDDWNEWGFFDYRILHNNLASYNCDILDFSPPNKYDAIYSISVLAHFLAAEREAALRLCKSWFAPDGLLLLALDLVPSTDFLWNFSGREEFESRSQHGTVHDVRQQLVDLGLHVTEFRITRAVYKSRTDLAFIRCTA